ncbi:MAG: hypothetical protein IJ845_09415 [Bacteroidaceae bacterium]|nr:hypothetical protein [Bacteroidaceae bacterium]
MSVYRVYSEKVNGQKLKKMMAVADAEEYRKLRGSRYQHQLVNKARKGQQIPWGKNDDGTPHMVEAKTGLVQFCYSCLPGDDGLLAGSTKVSGSVGMDVDLERGAEESPEDFQRRLDAIPALVLAKKEELGLLMMERSASKGFHIVFRRRPELSQEENLIWASQLLGVKFDEHAKDITRVFFTTTDSAEDLLYLDAELFCIEECKDEASAQPNSQFSNLNSQLSFKGIPYADLIAEWWKQQVGEPAEGERNTSLHRLAVHLRTICDNRAELLLQIMPRFGLSEQEMVSIINSATKDQPRGKTREIQAVLATFGNDHAGSVPSPDLSQRERDVQGNPSPSGGGGERADIAQPNPQFSIINSQLENWGKEIEKLFPQFPILSDICRGLKPSQYPAALFVAGSFLMTLMTRCTYRFYHRPEELRRLNSSTIIVGDPASGKSFATRLWKLLMAPIFAADKAGKEAINAYRELMKTKGANKEKPKKPKVVVRVHPARTSNAQFIQDMVNAVETVDGEEMQLHMVTFDTELDNTLSIQKGGSWIDKISLELKAFHNEEDGQAYSNVDSVMQDFYVTWNYVYTGTPLALKKKVNEQNFGSGLATRLTCIPLPSTNFEMMSRERTIDVESDNRLRDWAFKLDRMKGELSLQKIVDELYDWTARRMADAQDNESRADEMLLKRCAYHGLNFAAPFIVMRHWDAMQQEGDYWCGTFETDDIDWQLAELIVNMQFACQKHYFGAMAEAYFDNKLRDASVNVQRRQKTFEAFSLLPEEFTNEDVQRCFNLNSEAAARMRIKRLINDHLVEKKGSFIENGTTKACFTKTGVMML